ncbi:MAG: phage integrase [Microvirga sp.]|jgi:integrase/recombinase XerD|nr:phage integrase [Microvirga sp.]
MQLGAAVDDFLRFCALERRFSEHTTQAYRSDLADFSRALPPGIELAEVAPEVLRGYLEDMVGRRLSAATVRRRFACLRAFFRRAAALGRAPDPFGAWRPQLPRRKRLPRALSRPEVSVLVGALGADGRRRGPACRAELGLAVRLMLCTGLRVGELCRLRLDDVSPDGATLRVHGKGARDRVAFVADAKLRAGLCAAVRARRRTRPASDALLVNGRGAPLRPQSVRSDLRRLARAAGLPRRLTPHMLRHTAATLLIEGGVDIRFVQRVLGHASIATTEIYTHVSDEALRTTLERADVLGRVGRG